LTEKWQRKNLQPSIVAAQFHTLFTDVWAARILLPVSFVTLVKVPLSVKDCHQHVEVLGLFPATERPHHEAWLWSQHRDVGVKRVPWGAQHLNDDRHRRVQRIDNALALKGANLARFLVQEDFDDIREMCLADRRGELRWKGTHLQEIMAR